MHHPPPLPNVIKRQISPALLAANKKEALAKLDFVRKSYPRAHMHIDATDGKFVPSHFWCKPTNIGKLGFPHTFEAHLMTYHPEKRVAAWKRAGASRIVFHFEATENPLRVIDTIKKHRLEAGVALNLETAPRQIELLLERLDSILFMAIEPGFAGMPFHPEVIPKIAFFHKKYPKKFIIVDGGVSLQNAEKLLKAGARQLVSTTLVYGKNFGTKNQ